MRNKDKLALRRKAKLARIAKAKKGAAKMVAANKQ